MTTVVIVGNKGCPRCVEAVQICESKGIQYAYKTINENITIEALEIIANTRISSVPQVFISEDGLNTYVGGFNELKRYAENFSKPEDAYVDLDQL